MPRLPRVLLSSIVALAMLAGACSGGDAANPVSTAAPTDGEWPHDFVAPLLGGGSIDAGDYAGQDLVLWFWAPW